VFAATLAALVMAAGVACAAHDAEPAVDAEPAAAAAPAAESWRQLTEAGYHQLAAGEITAALDTFEQALQLNPRGAAAKTGKGAVLARQGKLQEAEKLLREALVLNPDPARTHYELGRIYQQQGDYQRASDEFKQGIEKYRESHP
jgi:tetratricopeptide (TPR) repeat protein